MADQDESAGKAQALATVDVSTLCRRGVLRGSVTRIDTRVQELEATLLGHSSSSVS